MNERNAPEQPGPSTLQPPDFRALFESLPGLYLVLSPDFTVVAASDAYLRATLTRREEILGRCVFEVFPDNPADPAADGVRNLRASLERVVRQRVADAMPVQRYDVRRPQSEGGGFEERYWSPANSPMFGAGGQVAYVLHRAEDVTRLVLLQRQGAEQERLAQGLRDRNEEVEAEISLRRQEVAERRRVEAELREVLRRAEQSESRFSQVWDQTRDAVRLTDSSGTILRANPAYCALVGRPRESVEGVNFSELYAQPERARVIARHRERFAGRSVEPLLTSEITLWDGRRVHLEFASSFLELPGEPPLLLSVIRGVGPRVALEERYRQAQKMEAVGRLAGGVAHDFNNLLTVINGYGELLLGRLPQGDPSRALVREVASAGERAAGLTRQLLAFSRRAVVEPKVIRLQEVVAETESLLRRVIGEDIDLATVAAPEAASVRADPGQLAQVLMNLAVNARDAMPRGGKLTVEVRDVDLDESYARTQTEAQPGPHVLLAVSDTGHGIPAGVLPHLFEPFFTTKEAGKGTGLGLSVVHGIVKQAGGHVGVYSEVGKGTTFKVYLPQARQVPAVIRPSRQAVPPMPRGGETVLLVEDEDAVRALVRHVLAGCGYAVLEAADGEEALRVAAGHPGRIDLLMTDVVMPRLGGREVAQRLAGRHPGLKVLYCSGYTDDAVVRHGILEESVSFLQKPFAPAALARKVRDVLDG